MPTDRQSRTSSATSTAEFVVWGRHGRFLRPARRRMVHLARVTAWVVHWLFCSVQFGPYFVRVRGDQAPWVAVITSHQFEPGHLARPDADAHQVAGKRGLKGGSGLCGRLVTELAGSEGRSYIEKAPRRPGGPAAQAC